MNPLVPQLGNPLPDREPRAAELAAIALEWPLIEAEMALVGAEITVLTAEPAPSPVDWRRLRRAERRVLRELLTLLSVAYGATTPDRLVA